MVQKWPGERIQERIRLPVHGLLLIETAGHVGLALENSWRKVNERSSVPNARFLDLEKISKFWL